MQKEYLMVFEENQNELFTIKKDESDLKCLSLYCVFPAKFIFNDGKELTVWLHHTYHYDYRANKIVHELRSTTIDFELYIKVDGEVYGGIREQKSVATVWSDSSFNTYYIDKYGQREFIEALDEKGEDVPDSPGTCVSCGYDFRITNDFVDGKCSGCHGYDSGKEDIPDLNSSRWRWDDGEIDGEETTFMKKIIRTDEGLPF